MLYAIVLAAGSGNRMKSKEKKQFIKLKNKPVIYYSIDKLLSINSIDNIVLVISENDKNSKAVLSLISKYKKYIHSGKICMILGGKERYDSVYFALDFIDYYFGISKNDSVLIHDSARPNFMVSDVKKLILNLKKYKSITLGSKLTDTIKKVNKTKTKIKKVKNTLDRNDVYTIKTPQAFNLKILYDAYEKFYKLSTKPNITDDVQIIEKYSKTKSHILESSNLNIKLTTKDDLLLLKSII